MNLYKVTFSHHAPKDGEQGIKALILAENDEQVYNWIASEPKINDGSMFNSWKDREEYSWNKEKETFVDKDGDEVDEGWWDEEGEPENQWKNSRRIRGHPRRSSAQDSGHLMGGYYELAVIEPRRIFNIFRQLFLRFGAQAVFRLVHQIQAVFVYLIGKEQQRAFAV